MSLLHTMVMLAHGERLFLWYRTLTSGHFKLDHPFRNAEVIRKAQDVESEAKCDDPLEDG